MQFKILNDNQNILVAIRVFDNEIDKIIREGGRRDEFNGNIVGVKFDSYHDHRTGFKFDVTAMGQKIDLIITNLYNDFHSCKSVMPSSCLYQMNLNSRCSTPNSPPIRFFYERGTCNYYYRKNIAQKTFSKFTQLL